MDKADLERLEVTNFRKQYISHILEVLFLHLTKDLTNSFFLNFNMIGWYLIKDLIFLLRSLD